MATPPMLRPRLPAERPVQPVQRPRRDPLASLTVLTLLLIGLGLFAAGILAVYTYSTPSVEVPLVVAMAIAFAALLTVNLAGLALRQLRAGRW